MKRISLRIAILLGAIFIISEAARASTTPPPPPVVEAYNQSENVLLLKLAAVELVPDADGRYASTLTIEKVYKGALKAGGTLRFPGGPDPARRAFGEQLGRKFLLYLKAGWVHENVLLTGGGLRPHWLDDSSPDLFYLENLKKLEGKTIIFGVLARITQPSIEGEEFKWETLSRRRVTIRGGGRTFKVKTNKQGLYKAIGLPPGKYIVEPDAPAGFELRRYFLIQTYSPDLKPGQHVHMDMTLTIDNSVSGRVRDAVGISFERVRVDLIPARGKPYRFLYAGTFTEPDGSFKLDAVPAGTYLIVVNRDGKFHPHVPLDTFYYPGTANRKEAVEITVGPGDHIRNLLLTSPETADAVTISGRLVNEAGDPVRGESVVFYDGGVENHVESSLEIGRIEVNH